MKRELKKLTSYTSFYLVIILGIVITFAFGIMFQSNNDAPDFFYGIQEYRQFSEIEELIIEQEELLLTQDDEERISEINTRIDVYNYLYTNKIPYAEVCSATTSLSDQAFSFISYYSIGLFFIAIIFVIYLCRMLFAKDFETGLITFVYNKNNKMTLLKNKIFLIMLGSISTLIIFSFLAYILGYTFYNAKYIIFAGESVFKMGYFTYVLAELGATLINFISIMMIIISIFIFTKEANYSSIGALIIAIAIIFVPSVVQSDWLNSFNTTYLIAGKAGSSVEFYQYVVATIIKYVVATGCLTGAIYRFKKKNI